MRSHELDVVLTRGNAVESYHRVHAAVVGDGDKLIGEAGDPRTVTFWRSSAKPFQIMPFIASGGFDALGWGDEQLAIACGSHGGEPEHVAVVEEMLSDLGLEEGDLACGPQEPLAARGGKILRESGMRPRRTHNNCSGKHAAMLGYARQSGWPIEGYERIDHPVQQSILNHVALWTEMRPSQLELAVDGCGVVVFGLPLDHMARAYARLGCAARRGEEIAMRVARAMLAHPFLVGGTDRFDTILIEETEGRVVSKIGAEGVHSAVVVGRGIGIALKVEDGCSRAQYPALLHLLQELGELPDALPQRLAEFLRKPVRNTRGEVVGEIRMAGPSGARFVAPALASI
ncbi:MAG TPA: asparaginase [Gemmatimonadaceae bacterium]